MGQMEVKGVIAEGYLTWPIDTALLTLHTTKGDFYLLLNNLLGQYISFTRGQLEITCYQI